MGLQQFERRLERMVEGVVARTFKGSLQPVEIGRRLTREMDLRRTMAPKGTLCPNDFVVVLAAEDRARFASIEDELVEELVAVAKDHAEVEHYSFLGPVTVTMQTDDSLSRGMVLVSGEMTKPARPAKAARSAKAAPGQTSVRSRLLLPDGRAVTLGDAPVVIGRLPECEIVLSDPNVSRKHAQVRPSAEGDGEYEVLDNGSTNGTKVNGLPVTGTRQLTAGDTITVGATTIGYERG